MATDRTYYKSLMKAAAALSESGSKLLEIRSTSDYRYYLAPKRKAAKKKAAKVPDDKHRARWTKGWRLWARNDWPDDDASPAQRAGWKAAASANERGGERPRASHAADEYASRYAKRSKKKAPKKKAAAKRRPTRPASTKKRSTKKRAAAKKRGAKKRTTKKAAPKRNGKWGASIVGTTPRSKFFRSQKSKGRSPGQAKAAWALSRGKKTKAKRGRKTTTKRKKR